MSGRKRALIVLFTLLLCLGLDQVTKLIAKEHLPRSKVLSLEGTPFKLHYSENKGADFAFE